MTEVRNDLLESPRLTRLVVSLAWPVVAGMALHSLFSLTDLFWVGRLDTAAVAAVSTGFFLSWTLTSLGDMTALGALSLVSRRLGGGRRKEAAEIALQGAFWSLAMGLVLAVAGQFLSAPLFALVSDDPAVQRHGTIYLRVMFAGLPLWYLDILLQDVFRASGDTRTPLRVLTVAVGVNFVLDPFLIHGYGPFPALGTGGAALAGIVAHAVAAFLFYRATQGGRYPVDYRGALPGFRPRVAAAVRMVRIGFPLAATAIMYTVVYLALARIAGGFGTAVLAALGIVNRLESAAYLAAHALGIATSTLVGQNLGAGFPDRARALAARADRLAMGVGAIAFLLFLLVPGFLMRLFSDDPATVAEGARFLRIVSLCQIPQVWELVYEGGLTGAGRTLPAMLISLPVSLVRIPLAWLLSGPMGLGPPGIWWTISLTAILRGALMRWWWSRGTWVDVGDMPRPRIPGSEDGASAGR